MGQQQLLLIALSVIIVGAAVAVGVNMMQQGSDQAVRDRFYQRATTLAQEFSSYYKKPVTMGGAGQTTTNVPTDAQSLASLLGATTNDQGDAIYINQVNGTTEDDAIIDTDNDGSPNEVDYVTVQLAKGTGPDWTGTVRLVEEGTADWVTPPSQ